MAIPSPFGFTSTGTTLGVNLNTDFTTVSDSTLTVLTQPSISLYRWIAPSTTLGVNLNTDFTTVGNGYLITTPSAGEAKNYSFTPTRTTIGVNLTTFIGTDSSQVTVGAAPAAASTQIWYSS